MISGGTVNADTRILGTGWFVVAVAIAICLFPVYSYPNPTVLLDSDRQFQFAEDLLQRKEYYRAIGEYERFIYFFPEAEQVVLARYRIGLAYLRGERYEDAIEAFRQVIQEYPRTEYADKSYLKMSEAYVQLKRYDEAVAQLEKLIATTADQDIKDEAYYQCGWVCIAKGAWENAQTCFDKISDGNREKYRLEHLLKELDKQKHLKRKNPTAAGLLAILPGAGHLYCERRRDALLAFLVNGALIFAACEAFDQELYALGGIITVVELGFYSGNIYSAVSSAHKYNRDERNRFLRHLEERAKIKISVAGPHQTEGVLLSCQFLF
jgi:tetratricopeptide (TPR) repeat protein